MEAGWSAGVLLSEPAPLASIPDGHSTGVHTSLPGSGPAIDSCCNTETPPLSNDEKISVCRGLNIVPQGFISTQNLTM